MATKRIGLGTGGTATSPIALGMRQVCGSDVASAGRVVHNALDAGITLFDIADVFGVDQGHEFGATESLLGEVFKSRPALRNYMVLSGKGGVKPGVPYDQSAASLIAACEASLKRLNTDRIELYHIHCADLLAHPMEWAEALTILRHQGKIVNAGVSNFTMRQTGGLMSVLPFPLAATQPKFSVLHTAPLSDGTLDLAMQKSLWVLAWSPFAGGKLFAGTSEGGDAQLARVAAALDQLAPKYGLSRASMALAWIMRHPSQPVPVIGAQSELHIRDAVKACGVVIEKSDWYEILEASHGEKMP